MLTRQKLRKTPKDRKKFKYRSYQNQNFPKRSIVFYKKLYKYGDRLDKRNKIQSLVNHSKE